MTKKNNSKKERFPEAIRRLLSGQFSTVVRKLSKLLLPSIPILRSFYGFGNLVIKRLHRGRKGLKEADSISQFLTRHVLGATYIERPKLKIPNFVWELRRKSKNSYSFMYFTLCVCQIHRLVTFPPLIELGPILDRFSGSLLGILSRYREMLKSAKVFSETCKLYPLRPFSVGWRVSLKSGPNGTPSLSFAKEDLHALRSTWAGKIFLTFFTRIFPVENKEEVERMISQMDKSIKSKGLLVKSESKFGRDPRRLRKKKSPKGTKVSMDSKSEATIYVPLHSKRHSYMQSRRNTRPICVNRLAGLSDKKGKTRVVCIANIVLQSFLKPIHDHLFNLLRKLETDGTHDQEAQARRVCRATKLGKFCESIDMTACTDRFPALFQCWALSSLGILSKAQALLWYISLCCTPISYWNENQSKWDTLYYRVGQPMGALSSWAVMAMSHHLLVYWAFVSIYPEKSEKFTDYAIIGDDVVIWDPKVALAYREILKLLGIEISEAKSYRDYGLAEFAKGYYRKGHNLKPISPDLLLWNNQEGTGKLVGLIEELKSKSFFLNELDLHSLYPVSVVEFSTILALLKKDQWLFDSPKVGHPDLWYRLAVIRINSGIRSLKPERIHTLTSKWVVQNRAVYGGENYTSPYIAVGIRNSNSLPPVIFPSEGDTNLSLEILLGDDFIAWDPVCWPAGISTLLGKALNVGLSYTDLEIVTSKSERKPKFRMSRSFKSLRKIDYCVYNYVGGNYKALYPAFIMPDESEWKLPINDIQK